MSAKNKLSQMLRQSKIKSIKTFWTGTLGLPASVYDLKSLGGVSLYRNAVYLIMNYAVLGLSGFFFWIAAARLYSTEAVGLASSAISAAGLLTMISTLGMDFGLIRFLPGAGENRNALISSVFTIAGTLAISSTLIFTAGTGLWSPALKSFLDNPVYFIAFVIFVLANTLQSLSAQCFVAARASRYVLLQGIITGTLKFVPLVVLALYFEQPGIFLAWGIAIFITALVSMIILMPRAYAGIKFLPSFYGELMRPVFKFSLANFCGSICWSIPQSVLPLMVVNVLGAEQNAYFYIGWSIAGVVFMVPAGASYALLAEGSHNEHKLSQEVRKSLKLILLMILPAIAVLLGFGNFVLRLFGENYSDNALNLLRLLVVSSLPLSINYIFLTVRRVEKKMKSVILLTGFIAVSTLISSYFLMLPLGILGAALGWFISQVLAALFTVPYLWYRFFKQQPLSPHV
jgi:O-antigen/teichoic acid export membrane protein